MAEFPGVPRVTKGAILVFALPLPVPTEVIVFPCNPDTMSRRFDFGPGSPSGRAAAGAAEPTTPATPPVEQISVTLTLDAADQLEHPSSNPVTVVTGLLPVISALEQLIYPPQVTIRLAQLLAALGGSIITPPTRPWTVFVWGVSRIVPVRVTSLTITEQNFDARLNCIAARAELQLTTLSTTELDDAPTAVRLLADVHAVSREVAAGVNTASSLANAVSVLPL